VLGNKWRVPMVCALVCWHAAALYPGAPFERVCAPMELLRLTLRASSAAPSSGVGADPTDAVSSQGESL
jgi:hypothetical protein